MLADLKTDAESEGTSAEEGLKGVQLSLSGAAAALKDGDQSVKMGSDLELANAFIGDKCESAIACIQVLCLNNIETLPPCTYNTYTLNPKHLLGRNVKQKC